MIWWLNEIDKFYNYLKKRVLRGKFATDDTMKKKIMSQKNLFQGSATNFLFSIFVAKSYFDWSITNKNQFETLHTPQIEVWR
jgi:hypothetical protein